MQIKEVKILGYQSEKVKMTLTYQVSETLKRYIIRINRKIINSYPENEYGLFTAKADFKAYLYNDIFQMQLNL